MNRQQRREYCRKIKNNPAASICPKCGNKTLFYTTKVSYPKFYATEESKNVDTIENFEVKCQVCDGTVLEGEDVARVVPPGITLPVPLEQFKKIVIYEAERAAREEVEKKHEKRNEDNVIAESNQPSDVEGTT